MNYRVKGRFVSGGGREVVAGMRGVRHTSEKKRKETTCAERRGRRNERSSAHVRKEKEGNDVCGEARTPDRKEFGTRQRRKRKETTCAERRGRRIERSLAHVREEKEGNDVCGEARTPE